MFGSNRNMMAYIKSSSMDLENMKPLYQINFEYLTEKTLSLATLKAQTL